jgi:hypothetical protein
VFALSSNDRHPATLTPRRQRRLVLWVRHRVPKPPNAVQGAPRACRATASRVPWTAVGS